MSIESVVTKPDGTQYRLKCPDCGSTEVLDSFVCMECGREIYGGWDEEPIEASTET